MTMGGGGGGSRDAAPNRGGFLSAGRGWRTDAPTQSRSSARNTHPNAPAPKNLINCNRFGRCRTYPIRAKNGFCSVDEVEDCESRDQWDVLAGRGMETVEVPILC